MNAHLVPIHRMQTTMTVMWKNHQLHKGIAQLPALDNVTLG